jgi:hypothetical protein
MARDFDGSTDRIDYASISTDAESNGHSMSMWVKPDSLAANQYFTNCEASGAPKQVIFIFNITGQDRLIASHISSGDQYLFNPTGTIVSDVLTIGAWSHILYTMPSNPDTTSRLQRMWIDGVEETSSVVYSGTGDPNTTDAISLAGRTSTDDRNFNGKLAEVAQWNTELGDAEAAQLSSGVSPLLVRPDNLGYYAPLDGGYHDYVGGSAGTLDGTTASPHPPIIRPAQFTPVVVSDVPRVISVSTDDDVPVDEDPWTIAGTRFGAR